MSMIESAARILANLIKENKVSKADLAIFKAVVQGCDADPDGKKATYRAEAKRQFHSQGDLEFDDTAVVSLSEDEGAYVSCWKFIYADE